MKMLRRLLPLSALLAALVLTTSAVVFSQRGKSIITRVHFARGRTTVVEHGSVHRGVSHDYLLKAVAGQSMSVHLSARGGVCFDLYTRGTSESLAQCSRDWSGELTRSGDYRINVLPDTTTERSIPYTLEVTVR